MYYTAIILAQIDIDHEEIGYDRNFHFWEEGIHIVKVTVWIFIWPLDNRVQLIQDIYLPISLAIVPK